MAFRLLTDTEVKDVALILYKVGVDQANRLRALHEDGHPEREASERVIVETLKDMALIDNKTGAMTLRRKDKESTPTCECHRDISHEEGMQLSNALDAFADHIEHLFPRGSVMPYFEQLARELVRVNCDTGVFQLGSPGLPYVPPAEVYVDFEEKQSTN